MSSAEEILAAWSKSASADSVTLKETEFNAELLDADDVDELEANDDVCAVCGVAGVQDACGGCGVLEYCSETCARKHWAGYSFADEAGKQIEVPGHYRYCELFAKIDEDILAKDELLAPVLNADERTQLQIDAEPNTGAEPSNATIERWITDPWTGIQYWVPRGRRRLIYWPLWGWRPWWWRPWWWLRRRTLRVLPLSPDERRRLRRRRRGRRAVARGPAVTIRRRRRPVQRGRRR